MGVFQGLCQPQICHFRRKCDTINKKYTQDFVKSGDKTAEIPGYIGLILLSNRQDI